MVLLPSNSLGPARATTPVKAGTDASNAGTSSARKLQVGRSPRAESLMPVCSVFKRTNVFSTWDGVVKRGGVTRDICSDLGKMVLSIRGASATNFVKLPRAGSLKVPTRFVYVQYRLGAHSSASVHIELVRRGGASPRVDEPMRLSFFSTADSRAAPQRVGGALRCALPKSATWTTLAIDVVAAADHFFAVGDAGSRDCEFELKSFHLCAEIWVRDVCCSLQDYAADDAPKDMRLKKKEWLRFPDDARPRALEGGVSEAALQRQMRDDASHRAVAFSPAMPFSPTFPLSPAFLATPIFASFAESDDGAASTTNAASTTTHVVASPAAGVVVTPSRLQAQLDAAARLPRPASAHGTLEKRVGYSGSLAQRSLVFLGGGRAAFASGRALRVVDAPDNPTTSNGRVRVHTQLISIVVSSADGALVASAQSGDEALVCIWRVKGHDASAADDALTWLCDFRPHAGRVTALAFSLDDPCRLCTAGEDGGRRAQIIVWDVERLCSGAARKRGVSAARGAMALDYARVLKQLSDFEVSSLKWSPYEADRFVSCGRENVRFWRITKGHARGCPAALYEYARDARFNDLDFEPYHASSTKSSSTNIAAPDGGADKVVFVAAASGHVLQLSYSSRQLLCVLRLHDGPVTRVVATRAFVVTASADKFVRLWPLDFGDYLMEAQHEAAVLDIAVAPDGCTVLCGTARGSVGALEVESQSYTTLVRSHVGAVRCVAHADAGARFATCGEDATIRIWDELLGAQVAEFESPDDAPLCVCWRPSAGEDASGSLVVVVGFESGAVRALDVSAVVATAEVTPQHRGAVTQLEHSSTLLFSASSADGHIVAYDATDGRYTPLRVVAVCSRLPRAFDGTDRPADRVSMALSGNGRTIAALSSRSPKSVATFDAETLARTATVELQSASDLDALCFGSGAGAEALYLTDADGNAFRLAPATGHYGDGPRYGDGLQQHFPCDGPKAAGNKASGKAAWCCFCSKTSTLVTARDDVIELRHFSAAAAASPLNIVSRTELREHPAAVTCAKLSPSHRLVSCDAHGALCVWSLSVHQPKPSPKRDDAPSNAATPPGDAASDDDAGAPRAALDFCGDDGDENGGDDVRDDDVRDDAHRNSRGVGGAFDDASDGALDASDAAVRGASDVCWSPRSSLAEQPAVVISAAGEAISCAGWASGTLACVSVSGAVSAQRIGRAQRLERIDDRSDGDAAALAVSVDGNVIAVGARGGGATLTLFTLEDEGASWAALRVSRCTSDVVAVGFVRKSASYVATLHADTLAVWSDAELVSRAWLAPGATLSMMGCESRFFAATATSAGVHVWKLLEESNGDLFVAHQRRMLERQQAGLALVYEDGFMLEPADIGVVDVVACCAMDDDALLLARADGVVVVVGPASLEPSATFRALPDDAADSLRWLAASRSRLVVGTRDVIYTWALAVYAGAVSAQPLRRIALGAAIVSLSCDADAAIGVVSTRDGAFVYFATDDDA